MRMSFLQTEIVCLLQQLLGLFIKPHERHTHKIAFFSFCDLLRYVPWRWVVIDFISSYALLRIRTVVFRFRVPIARPWFWLVIIRAVFSLVPLCSVLIDTHHLVLTRHCVTLFNFLCIHHYYYYHYHLICLLHILPYSYLMVLASRLSTRNSYALLSETSLLLLRVITSQLHLSSSLLFTCAYA